MKHLSVFCLTLAVFNLLAQTNTEIGIQNAPNMVLVRGGTFPMGDSLLIGSIFHITLAKDAEPVSIVTVSDFYMSKYEVTNAEFVKFLNAKGNQTEGGVTWIDLDGYWKDEKCRIYQGNGTFMVEKATKTIPLFMSVGTPLLLTANGWELNTGCPQKLNGNMQLEMEAVIPNTVGAMMTHQAKKEAMCAIKPLRQKS